MLNFYPIWEPAILTHCNRKAKVILKNDEVWDVFLALESDRRVSN
jgi:hypothetical protein